jgi:hypothetical protein
LNGGFLGPPSGLPIEPTEVLCLRGKPGALPEASDFPKKQATRRIAKSFFSWYKKPVTFEAVPLLSN